MRNILIILKCLRCVYLVLCIEAIIKINGQIIKILRKQIILATLDEIT